MRKHIWFIFISYLMAIALGSLILSGSKTAFGILGLVFLAFLSGSLILNVGLKKIEKYLLYFGIISIPFPYLLQFSGKDALTITTLMIYFLFALIIFRHLFERRSLIFEPKFAFILPILVFVSLTISLILNPDFIGQSVRYYISNISGILLYFIILLIVKDNSGVITIIKIILFSLALQSGIILLVWKFPIAKEFLAPFTTRVTEAMNGAVSQDYIVEGIHRFAGTIWDYELLAEWFLVGSVLSIGLFYKFKKIIYIFSLFCCLGGIVFTVTRSVLFLLIFGLVLIFGLINMLTKDNRRSTVKVIFLIFLGSAILSGAFPEQISSLTKRLEIYFHHSNLISSEAINRGEVWKDALHIFLKEPTFFGKGLYNLSTLYYSVYSFHSLYLTILYKIGILGLFIYSIFWLKMLYESWRILITKNKPENWYVLFFLFISVVLILLNEIKIEYIRYGHTIQFAWLIYGLLAVSIRQGRGNNENTMVSASSG